jgi:hypothetical protein
MKKKESVHPLAALAVALMGADPMALGTEERPKRLRAAAAVIKQYEGDTQQQLIAVVCAVMRISETVFRQIMKEKPSLNVVRVPKDTPASD